MLPEDCFETFSIPQKGQTLANPIKNDLLARTLHFIPGQKIKGDYTIQSTKDKTTQEWTFTWNVNTDVFNATYFESEEDGSLAYIFNNGNLHYFTNFTGKKEAPLYWFFLAMFKVPLGFLPNSIIRDNVPVNILFGGAIKFLQDFFAPLFLFLKADYKLDLKETGDILSSGDMKKHSQITKQTAGKKIKQYDFDIAIKDNGKFEIDILENNFKIKMTCKSE